MSEFKGPGSLLLKFQKLPKAKIVQECYTYVCIYMRKSGLQACEVHADKSQPPEVNQIFAGHSYT